MDRNKLIKLLQDAATSDITALDSRHQAVFNESLNRGVQEKLLSVQERANFSKMLNDRRVKLSKTPLRDANGQVLTKNVKLYSGKQVTKPMTAFDLLEYDKDEQGNIIPGKYRLPENALQPIYPGGQVGKIKQLPANEQAAFAERTLGKSKQLANQFSGQQQAARTLEETQGMSALTAEKYPQIAAGGAVGTLAGMADDVQAIVRLRQGENREAVLKDIYGTPTATATQNPFEYGMQSTRFIGQSATRGLLPAAVGMAAGGAAGAVTGLFTANPLVGLAATFGGSIKGAEYAQKYQSQLFDMLAGDTGVMVKGPDGKMVPRSTFSETAGMISAEGEKNPFGKFVGETAPNAFVGGLALPALFNVKKITEVAKLAGAAAKGEQQAINALAKMGMTAEQAQTALALQKVVPQHTGIADRALSTLGRTKPVVAFKNASQFLGEASGVTKAFSPSMQAMQRAALAIKAHPELSAFQSELTESVAETGSEIQSAIENYKQIEEENERRKAKGEPLIEHDSIIQTLATALAGISFEGESKMGHIAFKLGQGAVYKPLEAAGYDTNPATRAIAQAIKAKPLPSVDGTMKVDAKTGRTTIASKERIVGLGGGEFAVFNPDTKEVRITNAAGIDPRAFGLRSDATAPVGAGAAMADAASVLLPAGKFGKVREFSPVGPNKEVVIGATHDGMVIRRQVTDGNKIDVRVVSVDQLAPENQSVAMSFLNKAGVKPSTETGYVEDDAYTSMHEEGNLARAMSGSDYKAFKEAFPAMIALDQGLTVHGRVIRMEGKNHAVVQIPSVGNGTDIIVVPTANLMSNSDSIRAREAIDDNETNVIAKQSELPQDPKAHNPISGETDRISDAKLDGGRNPIMLTPEQAAAASAKRASIASSVEALKASGMAEGLISNKRGNLVKSGKTGILNGVAKDSGAYPPGSYIEHTDASGNTVGGIVIRNTPHGPLIRPLDNGLPYVAQHTTITSGEPTRPKTEATAPSAEATAETATEATAETGEKPKAKPKPKPEPAAVETPRAPGVDFDPAKVEFIELGIPDNPLDPYGDVTTYRVNVRTGEFYGPDAVGNYHREATPTHIVKGQQEGPDGIERIDIGINPLKLKGTPLRQGMSYSYNVKTGEMLVRLPSADIADKNKWEPADSGDFRVLDKNGKSVRTAKPAPSTPTAEEADILGVTRVDKPEIAETSTPSDIGAAEAQVGRLGVLGTMDVTAAEDKAIATISTALEGTSISGLIAQKPRNKAELIDALTDFLIGTPGKGGPMDADTARKAATALSNFYDRMIYAQANRVLQMAQDRLAGFDTSRVGSPNKGRKTASPEFEYRQHRAADLPLIGQATSWMDDAAASLSGEKLTWAELNAKDDAKSKDLAVRAVEAARRKLMSDYYESSVPAIGVFDKAKELNDSLDGAYAAIEDADGNVVGRMLIGFSQRTFSTAVHEIGHALLEAMPEDMQVDALKHLGHTPREKTATNASIISYEAHEKFATALEASFLNAESEASGIRLTSRRGVVPEKLDKIFTDLSPFMRDVYDIVYGETGNTNLTWRVGYRGNEDGIFLWDNMPLLVEVDGKLTRCKIPLVPFWQGKFKKGPGILKANDPTEFEIEIVQTGHPRQGEKITITNSQIEAIGGLTNGFNKRMASTLAYWMGKRINQASSERRYTGITDYAETSPAAISGAKAKRTGVTVTPAAAVEGTAIGTTAVESTPTPEPGSTSPVTPDSSPSTEAVAPSVQLPAPQMADKATYVEHVLPDIMTMPGTEKLNVEQVRSIVEATYDINRQNSSVARDKWLDYEVAGYKTLSGQPHIDLNKKSDGTRYRVNMTTGAVSVRGADNKYTPLTEDKTFARGRTGTPSASQVQAGIDAVWAAAGAPTSVKPQVKGFLHYIAQLHGQVNNRVMADWLPVKRSADIPQNAAEADAFLSKSHDIDGNIVTFDTIPTVRGDMKVLDYDGRLMVSANVNGVKVLFYISSGQAGKVKVQPGRWYPVFGIGEDGWINKTSSEDMVTKHNSEVLKAITEYLDTNFGDLRRVAVKSVPVEVGSPEFEFLNDGLLRASRSETSGADSTYHNDVRAIVAQIEASKGAIKEKAEQTKAKRKKKPSPLTKSVSSDAAVLNAVGMKDFTQDDLDAIGRELTSEQYEALQDPNVEPLAKDALLRLGYAKRVAGVILATSTDREVARQVSGSRNALRAKLEIVEEVRRVIDYSRSQVALAEATDADGRVKALSEYEKLTDPTDANPVISLRQKATNLVFNVNLKTGQTTVTLPDGSVNTSAGLEFLETADGLADSPIWDSRGGARTLILDGSIATMVGQTNRNKRFAEKNGIKPEKMPQIYSGMLHIARMFAAVPINGQMTAPVTPSNVLYKINNVRAFNEVRSRPLYSLRQLDRNKAVGTPATNEVNVRTASESTVDAIKAQEHDNHSMKLIDRSDIMRVKSKDEPTTAQELRASIIDQKVKEIMGSRGEILSKLRAEIKKSGKGEIREGAEPFVYRIIEPSEYIDEETGQFALKYEMEDGEYVLNDAGERIPILDNDGEPVKDTRLVQKYVMSYSKQPMPDAAKAFTDLSSTEVYLEDGTRITDSQPFDKMERAVKSGSRYVFYDAVMPSKDGNGSTREAQDLALDFIVQSYKTLAARMLQRYTPIVQWDGNDLAGMQVWARATPELTIKTPTMNGVNVASVVIGAAKTPYNIDAVGATNRWQSTKITQYDSKPSMEVPDVDLKDATIAGNQHYYSVHKVGSKFVYKITATNINTKEVGVFTSEKSYATEADAKKAAQQEYKLLRGQAYDIWHQIGAEKIANDVIRLAELSRKPIEQGMSEEEKIEIFNAKVIMRQYDWYRGVSQKIMKRYGAAGLAMADLVGGTSPQTPVDANWTNAVQALQMMNRTATYERIVREYSGDKHYFKVPFNTERSVQVFAIWRALQAKAVYWRGANADGSPASKDRMAKQRAQRKSDYDRYLTGKGVNEAAIRAESDDTLKRFVGDEIVSKLETKIPDNMKRKMLEDVAISLVKSTVWTKMQGGQDPVASFTGWAQKTDDWLPTDYTRVVPSKDGTTEEKFTNQIKKMDFTVLPRNIFSGSKFGANTDNVLQGMFNTWLDISEEGQAPKARNFSLNLVGLSSGATIDVWAARYVRRMYHEWHQTTEGFDKLPDSQKTFFARVPPAAEQGVEGGYLGKSYYSVKYGEDGVAEIVPAKYQRPNPAEPTTGGEFGTGQAVMGLATQYINAATGGKLQMLPSDLQAIVWFAEKQLWMNNGWTNASGAGGSFEYQFAQDVLRYGDLDRFNVMMSGNGVQHLTPEQKERLMQIMRRTLWTEGPTTEGSPIAHLSALVSNSNGNQLDAGGQTQVDINLVAKRGSTPQKPYDPENDIHAVVLNMTPDGIKEILNGREALRLPTNLLNEHSGRRISLAYRDGKLLRIVGTAVFDGGQAIGNGLYAYQQVPSNELTDSRPVILGIPAEIHKLPESIDSNQLVHIKPNMWKKNMATYVNSATANGIYPARTDAGKHRRIREHVAYNVNLLKNAAADMLRISGGNDAVISRVVAEPDGSDDINYDPMSNMRVGHEIYFKPALADERIDEVVKQAYNTRFSEMIRRMENFFREKNSHVQFVVQQDPRNQYSKASLVNGNVGILAVWSPETEIRYLDFGAGVPDNMLSPQQKQNLAKLADYMSGDAERIRKHEEEWNNLFTEFWSAESRGHNGPTIPVFQNFANHYDVNVIHKEALNNETAPATGIDDQSTAWGLGIREKLEHSVQQLGISVRDGRVLVEADTRSGAFNEVLAGDVEKKLQGSAPVRVALYSRRKFPKQKEFHVHAASYAGSRMPGLAGVYDYAMDAYIRGNQEDYEKAMGRLSDRVGDELNRVFGETEGVTIDANRNTGIFFGDVEPSIDATVKVDSSKYDIDYVLARAAHVGLMFRQQNVYVTQDADKSEVPGDVNDDLGYSVEYRTTYKLSEPLTFTQMKEIQKALNLGGANLSQDGTTLTTFTVSTEGESHNETTEQWYKGISQLGEILQAQGISATVKQDVCRLWNTGSAEDGAYGRFTPYSTILDNLRRNKPSSLVPYVETNKYNRRVAEVKRDVEFALSMLRGKDVKLPENISFKRTPVSIETQMAIADNYDRLPMNTVVKGPYQDPLVVKAYESLVKELDKQWKWLNVKIDFMPTRILESGDIEFIDSYNASSAEVIADIRNNNHLFIYPTTPDTFGEKGMDFTGHPMLEVSPHKTADGKPMLWNDVLRAVHDALAHAIYGASFGANGEEIAFATHALLTEDPMAIWALNSETRAQNSWVNFNAGSMRNPDGSMKTDLPDLSERPFAAQKAALMPIQTLYTGIEVIDNRIDALRKEMETKYDGYNGSIPAEDIVDVPMTDGFRVKGNAAFSRRTLPAGKLFAQGNYVAGDVNVLSDNGISLADETLNEFTDYIADEAMTGFPRQAAIDDAFYKGLSRIATAYLGAIQRGEVPNPAPDRFGLGSVNNRTTGYELIWNGLTLQIQNALAAKKLKPTDLKGTLSAFKALLTEHVLDMGYQDNWQTIGEWVLEEGTDWKHFGRRMKDPVTGEYRNHQGELMPSPELKDKFEWENGRIVMYHATLHGKTIGNNGGLLSGDDVAWGTGKENQGLGGTTSRISLTYNKLYALDVIKMLTNYIRIANSSEVKKKLDTALTDRVEEALSGSGDNHPINKRIRFKFTQIAYQYATNMNVPYAEAKDFIDNLWQQSGSVHQFLTNLADIKYTNQYGSELPAIQDVAGALAYHKAIGNGGLKGVTPDQTSERQQSYHDYIRQVNYILGTPYTLILPESLQTLGEIDPNSINPVVYRYTVDPNMRAEHTPYEEELRTFTTGIMESTGDMFDASGDLITDVSEGYVPSRPAFAWRLKRKGAVPVPPPAPTTPTPTPPPTTWQRIVNGYDTFNDFARLSVGGDASPILIQNFMLANPIEDPKLFFHQFLLLTKAARPNLALSWKGKTIINGKNYGRQADVDLGNELRANPWYDSGSAHGLTLSAYGKDKVLEELRKTNPSATLMDISELGYNQDVSVSNELLHHMPGQGMSERFFSMSKDYVKMNKYAQAVQHLVDIGYVPGTEGFESAARDIAAVINVASGDMIFRDTEEADNTFGRIAKRLFFAPRWASSRFALDPLGRSILQATPWGRDVLSRNRMLNLQDRDPYAKAMQTRMMAKTYGLWAAFALLYGYLYKNEAIKTSVSKGGTTIQIGDYKFKPPAGIDKTIAMVTSAWSIFDASDKLSREEKIARAGDNIKTMFMGQSAPAVSAIYETVTGRNLFGEPSREVYTPLQRHWEGVTRPILANAGVDVPFPKISNVMADKLIYLWAQDMMESYEAMKDRDEPYAGLQSAAIGASSFIGGRVRYSPKDTNWKYDAAKNRPAPGIANTIIGADAFGSGDMEWDKLTR